MLTVRFAGSIPKQEQSVEFNDDRYRLLRVEDGGMRVAVADGASSSLFSGEWAELLTTAFVAENSTGAELPHLEPLQRRWFEMTGEKSLLWHQQLQVAEGAAAAFIGVAIDNEGRWQAVSVGDCLLVTVTADEQISAFPATVEEDLKALPLLLQTHPARMSGIETSIRFEQGTLGVNDNLFLMTDAIGLWFLREWKAGALPYRWLMGMTQPRIFQDRIRGLRRANRIADDDVTLIHIVRIEEEDSSCPHP